MLAKELLSYTPEFTERTAQSTLWHLSKPKRIFSAVHEPCQPLIFLPFTIPTGAWQLSISWLTSYQASCFRYRCHYVLQSLLGKRRTKIVHCALMWTHRSLSIPVPNNHPYLNSHRLVITLTYTLVRCDKQTYHLVRFSAFPPDFYFPFYPVDLSLESTKILSVFISFGKRHGYHFKCTLRTGKGF